MTVTTVAVPVDTRAPTGRTNAYLLGERDTVLVDPADGSDALDRVVADLGVDHLAVTHTHPDHVGGIARYADRTAATVWARYGAADRFEAATGVTPDRRFLEGTVIHGGCPVRVLDLPGHTPDHAGFVVRTTDGTAAVVGDVAVAEGSVFVGAGEGDMRAYYTTLRRLIAQNHTVLYPGHGDPITDPASRVAALLAHRLDRERRIEAVVATGVETIEDIVEAAYEKDLSGVRDLARATVAAHLEKLDREGRVAWDGVVATPVNPR